MSILDVGLLTGFKVDERDLLKVKGGKKFVKLYSDNLGVSIFNCIRL